MTIRAYIVDDSSTVRDNLIDTLRELAPVEPVGHSDNEHDARRWLLANDWDVAIIDLFLRVGSGMNVLQAVRKQRPGQRVVVLTNHSSRDVRWRCRQLGADAVFDKSTELEALVDYCKQLRAAGTAEAAPAASVPLAPTAQTAA